MSQFRRRSLQQGELKGYKMIKFGKKNEYVFCFKTRPGKPVITEKTYEKACNILNLPMLPFKVRKECGAPWKTKYKVLFVEKK